MASPSIRTGHTGTGFASTTTSWVVNLPSTVESGDDLVVVLSMTSAAIRTITPPSGWTSVQKDSEGSNLTTEWFTKDSVDGSEDSGTATFTIDTASIGSAYSFAVADSDGSGPIFATAATNTGSANPDPPSNTHGLGAVDVLAVAFFGARDDDATVSSFPSGYTHMTGSQVSGGGTNNGAELGLAALQTTAASVDPGTFTLSESENWLAQTAVFGPAGAATSPSVRSGVGTGVSTTATDWVVTMPATVESGDTLAVVVAVTSSAERFITPPSGWTSVRRETNLSSGSLTTQWFTKDTVDGTEDGTTETFVLDVPATGSAYALAIQDGSGTFTFATPATGQSANPDPPSNSHGLGSVGILALAVAFARDDDATVSAYPSGYTHFTDDIQSGGGTNNGAEIGIAALKTTATSVDPGTFTLSESEIWLAQTAVMGLALSTTTLLSHTSTGGVELGGAATVEIPTTVVSNLVDSDVQVLVDWDGDGNFDQAVEDITGYVTRADILYGRDFPSQLTGKSTPGRVRLHLDNTDDRFSFFNPASPLNTDPFSMRTGRLVRIQIDTVDPPTPTLLAKDRFSGSGPLGLDEEGNTWEEVFGATWTRSGNGYATASDDAVSVIDLGVTEAFVTYRVRDIDPPNAAAIIYRYVDNNNYGAVQIHEAFIRQYIVSGGSPSFQTSRTIERRDDMQIGAHIQGSSVAVYLDGVELFTDTNIFTGAGTKFGMYNTFNGHRAPKAVEWCAWDAPWQQTEGVIYTADLTRISPTITAGGGKEAVLEAEGWLGRLTGAKISPPDSTGVTSGFPATETGLMVGAVLAEVGLLQPPPPGGLDLGNVKLGPVGIDSDDAITIIREFEEAEVGFLYETNEGPVTFDQRNARDNRLATTILSESQSYIRPIERFEILDWRREIINRVTAEVSPQIPGLNGIFSSSASQVSSTQQNVTLSLPGAADGVSVGDLLLVGIIGAIHTDNVPWLRPSGWTQLSGAGSNQGEARWYAKKVSASDLGADVTFYEDTGVAGGAFYATIYHSANWYGDVTSGVTIAEPQRLLYDIAQAGNQESPTLVSPWGRTPVLMIAYRSGMVSLDNTQTTVSFVADRDEPAGFTNGFSAKVEGNGANVFDCAWQDAIKDDILSAETLNDWGGTFTEFDFIETGVVAIRGFTGDPPRISGGREVTRDNLASQDRHNVVRTHPKPGRLFADTSSATAYADLILGRHSDDRPILRVGFSANRNTFTRREAYRRRLGDRIRIIADGQAGTGIDAAFFIESIRHDFHDGIRGWDVTWELSPAGDPPDDITEISGTAGDTQATVAWSPPFSDPGILWFDIWISTTSAVAGFSALAPQIPASSTFYTATGLTNGTTYWLAVRSFNVNGVSDFAVTGPLTPAAASAVPGTIDDLTATAGDAQVTLQWAVPNDDPSITSYDIERSTTSAVAGFSALATDITPATSYVDSTASNGTQYWYRVRATNSFGDADWSNVATATPAAAGAASYPSFTGLATEETSFVTTHDYVLPTLAVDDRCLLIVNAGHESLAASTDLSDWTLLDSTIVNTFQRVRIYEIHIDDAAAVTAWSGATVSFTTSTGVRSTGLAIRVEDAWVGAGAAYTFAAGTAGASVTTPDPPSVTASWGQDLNSFLAIATAGSTGAAVTSRPSGYGTITGDSDTDATTAQYLIATAFDEVNAATDNPGTFTINDPENTKPFTIVYRPAVAGTGGGGGPVQGNLILTGPEGLTNGDLPASNTSTNETAHLTAFNIAGAFYPGTTPGGAVTRGSAGRTTGDWPEAFTTDDGSQGVRMLLDVDDAYGAATGTHQIFAPITPIDTVTWELEEMFVDDSPTYPFKFGRTGKTGGMASFDGNWAAWPGGGNNAEPSNCMFRHCHWSWNRPYVAGQERLSMVIRTGSATGADDIVESFSANPVYGSASAETLEVHFAAYGPPPIDQWIHRKAVAYIGTPGNADGWLKSYVDGDLVSHLTGIRWRDTAGASSDGWNRMYLSFMFGGAEGGGFEPENAQGAARRQYRNVRVYEGEV